MNVKQISVLLDNMPGKLFDVTDILAHNGVSIRALSVMDNAGTSTLRLIVDNVMYVSELLKKGGFVLSFADVVVAEIPNVPGGLNQVLSILKKGEVNIDYMYAVGEKYSVFSRNPCIVFKFTDNSRANKILSSAGILTLDLMELATL